jgi:hypothetical protein
MPKIFLTLLLMAAFLLPFIGCSSSTPDDDNNGNSKLNEDEILYNERFDFSPYIAELDVPESPELETSDRPFEMPSIWFTFNDDRANGQNVKIVVREGYRIHLYATDDLKEAEQFRNEVMNKTGIKDLYIDFNPPVFKVKLGNFIDLQSAKHTEFYLEQLGYTNCRIMREKIDID